MSCKIYCIEDCNGLKYVGSTKQTLNKRFSNHKCDKKRCEKTYCSSYRLDLDNCEIKLLETCDISHRKKREKYWINNTDCVNTRKLNFDRKEYFKKNKDKYSEYKKEYNLKNKDIKKEYDKIYHQYRKSWGGNMKYNNNLLNIDITLFQ